MSISIIEDYTLIHDNDVIIQIIFVRFDLPKVENTYLHNVVNIVVVWSNDPSLNASRHD